MHNEIHEIVYDREAHMDHPHYRSMLSMAVLTISAARPMPDYPIISRRHLPDFGSFDFDPLSFESFGAGHNS